MVFNKKSLIGVGWSALHILFIRWDLKIPQFMFCKLIT